MSAYNIKIPAEAHSLIKRLDLKRWVAELPDLDPWFRNIEDAKRIMRRGNIDHEYEMSNEETAEFLAYLVEKSHRLNDFVIEDVGAEVKDGEWPKMCLAAAWIILNCYYRDVEEEKWPR